MRALIRARPLCLLLVLLLLGQVALGLGAPNIDPPEKLPATDRPEAPAAPQDPRPLERAAGGAPDGHGDLHLAARSASSGTLEQRLTGLLGLTETLPPLPEQDGELPLETALTLFANTLDTPVSTADLHRLQDQLPLLTPTQRHALAALLTELSHASLLQQHALAGLTPDERDALALAATAPSNTREPDEAGDLATIPTKVDRALLNQAARVAARAVDEHVPALTAEPTPSTAPAPNPLVDLVARLHAAAVPAQRVPLVPTEPILLPTNDPLLAPALDSLARAGRAATAPAPGLTAAEADAWRTFTLTRGIAEALPALRAGAALHEGASAPAWAPAPPSATPGELATRLEVLAATQDRTYTSQQRAALHQDLEGMDPALHAPLSRLVDAMSTATLLSRQATSNLDPSLRDELSQPDTLLHLATAFSRTNGEPSPQELHALELVGRAGTQVELAYLQQAAYHMATTAFETLPQLQFAAASAGTPAPGPVRAVTTPEGSALVVDADGDGTPEARVHLLGDGRAVLELGSQGHTVGPGPLGFEQTEAGTTLYLDTNGNERRDCEDTEDDCPEPGVPIGRFNQDRNDIVFSDPFGLVLVSGTGTTLYHPDLTSVAARLTVDLGGTDLYAFGAGGGTLFPMLTLEVGGSDYYEQPTEGPFAQVATQGAGLLTAGVLVDAAGDDRYHGEFGVQGTSVLGAGVLIDLGDGRDSYRAWTGAQGYTLLGIGTLMDQGGDDSYHLEIPPDGTDVPAVLTSSEGSPVGQAAASTAGVATLVDLEGEDTYKAGPRSHGHVSRTSLVPIGSGPTSVPFPAASALFLDAQGRDTYEQGNGEEGDLLVWSTDLGALGADLGPTPEPPPLSTDSRDGDPIPDSLEAFTALATRVTGGALNVTLAGGGTLTETLCRELTERLAGPGSAGPQTTIIPALCGFSNGPQELRDQVAGRNLVRPDRADPQPVFNLTIGDLRLVMDLREEGTVHDRMLMNDSAALVTVLVDFRGNDTYINDRPMQRVGSFFNPNETADGREPLPKLLAVADLDGDDRYRGNFTTILDLAPRAASNVHYWGHGNDSYGHQDGARSYPTSAGLIIDQGRGADTYRTTTFTARADDTLCQPSSTRDCDQVPPFLVVGMPTLVFDDGGADRDREVDRTLFAHSPQCSPCPGRMQKQLTLSPRLNPFSPLADMDRDGVLDAYDPDIDGDGLLNEEEEGNLEQTTNNQALETCTQADQRVAGARRNGTTYCFSPTDPRNPDTDGDGVPDGAEVVCRIAAPPGAPVREWPVLATLAPPLSQDPFSPYLGEALRDTDGDGRCDSRDTDHNRNGICDGVDRDGDGVFELVDHDADGDGRCIRGDPDIDGDGIPNHWEIRYHTNPTTAPLDPASLPHPYNAEDALADPDGDGWANWEEYLAGTDPTDPTDRPPVRLLLPPLLDIVLPTAGEDLLGSAPRAPDLRPRRTTLHPLDVAFSLDPEGDDLYTNNAGAAFTLEAALAQGLRTAGAPYLATVVGGASGATPLADGAKLPFGIGDPHRKALETLWGTANLVDGVTGQFITETTLTTARTPGGELPGATGAVPFALLVDMDGDDTYESQAPSQASSGALSGIARDGAIGPAGFLRSCRMLMPSSNQDPQAERPPCQVPVGGDPLELLVPPTLDARTSQYTGAPAPVAGFGALFDLAGNDTYRPGHTMSHAFAGPGGIGLLIDLDGDDTLNLPQEGAFAPGNPSFYTGELQGAAALGGLAVLLDAAGNDIRVIERDGLAHAQWGGTALLADLAGDDLYLASSLRPSDPRSRSHAWSATGATALLWDHAGHDTYQAGTESLAAARGGLALLIETEGHDAYQAPRHAMAWGPATATYLGGHSDPSNETPVVSNLNLVPRDSVLAQRLSNGTAGWAILFDSLGDDTYTLTEDPARVPRAEGFGWAGPQQARPDQVPVAALFMDTADGATLSPEPATALPTAPERAWTGNLTGLGTASGASVDAHRPTLTTLSKVEPRCHGTTCPNGNAGPTLVPPATLEVSGSGPPHLRVTARLDGYPVASRTLTPTHSTVDCAQAIGPCTFQTTLSLDLPPWVEPLGPVDLEVALTAATGPALGSTDRQTQKVHVDTAPQPIGLATLQTGPASPPTLRWDYLGATSDLDAIELTVHKRGQPGTALQVDDLDASDRSYVVDPQDLPETDHRAEPWVWTLQATDDQGNTATSEPQSFHLDLLAPEVALTRPDPSERDTFVNEPFTFQGTFTDESLVRKAEITLREGGRFVLSVQPTLGLIDRSPHGVVTQWRAEVPALPTGDYELVVEGTDPAGHRSEARFPIAYDTQPPQVDLSLEPPGISTTGPVTLTGRVWDDSSGVELILLEGVHVDPEGKTTRFLELTEVDPHQDRVNLPLDLDLRRQGTYRIQVWTTDGAGNSATHLIEVPFDDLPPLPATSIRAALDEGVTRIKEEQTVLFEATAQDRDARGQPVQPWRIILDAQPLRPDQAPLVLRDDGQGGDLLPQDGIFSANITLQDSVEGIHDLAVTVVDVAGNTANSTLTAHVDNTPPIPQEIELLTTRSRVRLQATFDEPVRASLCVTPTNETGPTPCTEAGLDQAHLLEIDGLTPGTVYGATWRFEDLASHEVSERRNTSTLPLEVQPSVAIEAPAPNQTLTRITTVAALIGAPPGPPVTLRIALEDAAGEPVTERIITRAPGDPGEEHLISLDTGIVPDGTYDLVVEMRDLDGNRAHDEVPVIVDNTAPDLPTANLVGVAGNQGWFVTPPVIRFEASDATSGVERFVVSHKGDHHDVLPRKSSDGVAHGEWGIDAPGEVEVQIRAVDHAGNVGPEQRLLVRFDPTPPLAVLAPGENVVYANATGLRVPILVEDPESGITRVRLLVDGAPVTPWQPGGDTLEVRGAIDPGRHTLALEADNGAGVPASALGDAAEVPLFVDVAPPRIQAVTLPTGTHASPVAETTLEVTAQDALSGLQAVRYRVEGDRWSTWHPAATPMPLRIPVPDQPVDLEVQVQDRAGNPSEPYPIQVIHDTSPPLPPGRPVPVRESNTGLGLVWEPARDDHAVDRYLVYGSEDGTHFRLLGSPAENRFLDPSVILGLPKHYRVVAVDRAGWSSQPGPTARVVPHTLAAVAPPTLSDPSHSPRSAPAGTLFQFEVTYTDADNQAPTVLLVEINGERYPLTRSDLSDWDCKDGCLYGTSITLPPTRLDAGHAYRFIASDGTYSITLPEDDGRLDGPLVTGGGPEEPQGITGLRTVPTPPLITVVPLIAVAALLLTRRRFGREDP